jgi:hypothetical protein
LNAGAKSRQLKRRVCDLRKGKNACGDFKRARRLSLRFLALAGILLISSVNEVKGTAAEGRKGHVSMR